VCVSLQMTESGWRRPYGALTRADIKRNFAFVEFRRLEDATQASARALGRPVTADAL
jgi:hypothetical protein